MIIPIMNTLAHRMLSKIRELFTNIDQTIIASLPHILSCLTWLNSLNQHSHNHSTIGLQTFYDRSTCIQIHTFRGLGGYNGAKV
jgi:hypothetical protein